MVAYYMMENYSGSSRPDAFGNTQHYDENGHYIGSSRPDIFGNTQHYGGAGPYRRSGNSHEGKSGYYGGYHTDWGVYARIEENRRRKAEEAAKARRNPIFETMLLCYLIAICVMRLKMLLGINSSVTLYGYRSWAGFIISCILVALGFGFGWVGRELVAAWWNASIAVNVCCHIFWLRYIAMIDFSSAFIMWFVVAIVDFVILVIDCVMENESPSAVATACCSGFSYLFGTLIYLFGDMANTFVPFNPNVIITIAPALILMGIAAFITIANFIHPSRG